MFLKWQNNPVDILWIHFKTTGFVNWCTLKDGNRNMCMYVCMCVNNVVCFCAGKSEPLKKACGGHYGVQLAYARWEPTAGRLTPSCSWASSTWAPCTSRSTPFDFMKIPDIGDVMNKFEVLGIVGEGKSLFCIFILQQLTTGPVFIFSY